MARKKRRPALVAGTLLAGACGSGRSTPAPAGATEPPAVIGAPAAVDPSARAAALLAPDALYHDAFVRRTVYTWTTAPQVDELARTGVLLSRAESPTHGASYLDQVVHALARRGDPVATLLWTTPFARMRFAWHAPWATRAGWRGEVYGDRLIRVTLRPEAIWLALSTVTGAFEARTADGATVALADVLAHPERIGAIYFVSDRSVLPAPGLPAPRATHRELALCNEAMIESWAIGDDATRRELAREADALDALVVHLRSGATPWKTPAAPPLVPHSWTRPAAPDPSPEHAFTAALAFDNDYYAFDPDGLARLAGALRATPAPPAPITGGGSAVFPGPGSARPAPRVVGGGTSSFAASTMGSTWAAPPWP